MKKITVISGEHAGIWTLSSSDIWKGFLFLKTIPFTEMVDVTKRESIKREIFAEITLLNGSSLLVKMHEDVYEQLYTGYLKYKGKGERLVLPHPRFSFSHLPVTVVGVMIVFALLQDKNVTQGQAQTGVVEPQKTVDAPVQPKATIPALPELFQTPYRYISMPVSRASDRFGVKPNEGGNLVIDTPNHHILFEANNGLISYVDVEFSGTGPCSQTSGFDSEPFLLALGINPSSLELAKKQTHYHRYYDHTNRLKVGVSCQYDGANLSVGFSSKYYLQ